MQTLLIRSYPDARRLLGMALTLIVSACVAEAELSEGGSEGDETAAVSETGGEGAVALDPDSLTTRPTTAGGLYCSQINDCHDGCTCLNSECVPKQFGAPPVYLCDQPPVRACTSGADCRSNCACTAGVCKASAFGPLPATPLNCHLPPPDGYEIDDTWQNWKPYVGNPQAHTFHQFADTDWVAVYFGAAGSFRFRTQGLTHGTDTKLEVYTVVNGAKGQLVGSHDDVGGEFWVPDSKSSRIDLTVPAASSYLVRVINKSAASIYSSGYEHPSYTLKITAN